MALLKARHEDKVDLNDRDAIDAAAVTSGLDVGRFWKTRPTRTCCGRLARAIPKRWKSTGRSAYPPSSSTGQNPTFLKMFIPPDEQAVEIYDTLIKAMSQFAHVGEMKRPQPPWPHGVI